MNHITVGDVIRNARKQAQMQQTELAKKIFREDGCSITPQYLSDIEHGRRIPTSDYLITQFALALNLNADYLHYLNGRFPEQERQEKRNLRHFELSMAAFRAHLDAQKER